MALTLSTAAQNASVDAVTTLANGGVLELRDNTNTVVVSFTLPNPAFNTAVSGVASGNGLPLSATAAAGTIDSAHILDSVGADIITDLTVGLTGDTTDVEMTNLSPGSGSIVEITTLSYTQPAS